MLLNDRPVSIHYSVPFIILYLRDFLIYFNLYCSGSDQAILKRQFLIIYVIQMLFSGIAPPSWHLIEYYIKYANIFPHSYLQHTLIYLRNWVDNTIVFYLNNLHKNSPAILNIYVESITPFWSSLVLAWLSFNEPAEGQVTSINNIPYRQWFVVHLPGSVDDKELWLKTEKYTF